MLETIAGSGACTCPPTDRTKKSSDQPSSLTKWRVVECRRRNTVGKRLSRRPTSTRTFVNSVHRHLCWIGVFLLLLVARCHADEVQQPPRFVSQPSQAATVVSEGLTKILQCQAIGHPQPEYRWMKDDVFIGEFTSEHFYKIQSIKRDDGGNYRCIARNDVGAIFSDKVQVVVAYMAPYADQTSKTLTVRAGDAAILAAPSIESSPPPSVMWQANDSSLLYGIKYVTTSDQKLVILSVSESDQKAYRARATNTQVGQEENSGYIAVVLNGTVGEDEPLQIVYPPADAEVIKGTAVTELHCIANSRELHQIETTWYKDGTPIEQAKVSYSFNDLWRRTLSLFSVDTSHTGNYSCQVKQKYSAVEPLFASAQLTVLEKPKIINEMGSETVGDFGNAVNLQCQVEGIPKPNIIWYRNTVPIYDIPGKRYDISEDGTLQIRQLEMEDSGMFQCLCSNLAGEVSAYTWLRVKTSSPVWVKRPSNETVVDGVDTTLTCEVNASPLANVTWMFNNEPLVTSGRIQVLDQGNLLIAAVRSSDSGKYRCIRSNEAGSIDATSSLSVLVRTQVVQPPVNTRVILGHVATMQCKVSSDPAVPYEIQWFHDNRPILPNSSQRIRIQEDGTLEIQEVRASDVGEYRCVVTSTGGNDTRSAKLYVIELPYSPSNVKAEKLSAMTKAVNVSWTHGFNGNSPIVKFIIQKRIVPPTGIDPMLNWVTELVNVSADQRSVILTNLKASASYQFRVSAVNSVGEGTPSEPSNTLTLPQEPPSGPPVGLVGSARSPSQIIIQWQQPLDENRNGQILGYSLRYRLFGYNDSPWSYRNITNEAQRNYLIEELITWKDYEVQIAAYNEKGVGVYSDGIKLKTREGIPEAAPTDLHVEAVNSTSIQVTWKPPDPQKINGINQGYKIEAWKGEAGNESALASIYSVPPSTFDPLAEQTAIMPGLEKYTEYNITVLCFTNPGDGEKSIPVEVKTSEDVPDEVGSLLFEDITDRAVTVAWSPPLHSNGILQGYTLKYMVKDMPNTVRVKNMAASSHSIRVNHLQASTMYYFELFGRTSVGEGVPRVAIIQSGVEPVYPEAPMRLGVSNIEAFSVVLQFTQGFNGNSSITKWTIQGQTTRNQTWHNVYEVSSPDATTITVRNLIPFMQYRLRIIANNVVGASQPSEPTKLFQTIQASPSHAPHNVTVRALNATELRVRWIPLQQMEWYGIPRGYNISYRSIGSDSRLDSVSIEDHNANSFVLTGLSPYALYEVIMQAYNDVGTSAPSPVAVERTREAAPSAGPSLVEANATSSTTIVVRWSDVPRSHRNGLVEGFKVFYGAKGSPFKYKKIDNNSTFTTTLTELRKYSQYHIQVLAYTRVGDGVLSSPPVSVLTFEDVPGPPKGVFFPDLSLTMARIIWDVPEEPNGEILAYRLTYHFDDNRRQNFSMEFPPSTRTYRATDLQPERYYLFTVTARTRLGWGKTAQALVFTTNNRALPEPPSAPQISQSQIQSTQITFSWAQGRDGFAPLRYYTVQYSEEKGPWQLYSAAVSPVGTTYTVSNLKPFTKYAFRLQATNDMGPSGWSPPSEMTRTLPDAPNESVTDVKVVPITTTSVRVTWDPLPKSAWNGDQESGGYRIEYHQITDFPTALHNSPKEEIHGILASQIVLNDLVMDKNYEILVVPFNQQGDGPPSRPVTVYVGEAVPTGEPRNLVAQAVSATEVQLSWKPPLQNQQNGDLLGYKIFYIVEGDPSEKEEIEVVPASYNSHSLVFLDMYTKYQIQLLAFNPAGDGPRSFPVTVKTMQGIPGPPSSLAFSDITMASLKVTWEPPEKKNGEIVGYIVTYETSHENEDFSKQVKQRVNSTLLHVTNLDEEVSYTFSVRAITIDLGPALTKNITTGPQTGSPGRPKNVVLTKSLAAVELQWENGYSGQAPIEGYYIESKHRDETKYQIIKKTENGEASEFTVSYQTLLPSTTYTFRVIAYNTFGISPPAYSKDAILTPSKLYLEYGYFQQKPFYRQTWFLVAVASFSVIIVILIISILCITNKNYKYKHAQKQLEEENSVDENTTFPSVEMRQSRRSVASRFNSLGRKSANGTLSRAGKEPPRPSPASVTYSDDDSVKGYDENPDDSSLTEKPSEISSTDSQGTESENESVHSDPHSFVNHYANVNDTLRQSWKKQRPVKNYSSYTDSEPEGSAVMSLNGGQIIMNNMARSRAPLPGFSSFV